MVGARWTNGGGQVHKVSHTNHSTSERSHTAESHRITVQRGSGAGLPKVPSHQRVVCCRNFELGVLRGGRANATYLASIWANHSPFVPNRCSTRPWQQRSATPRRHGTTRGGSQQQQHHNAALPPPPPPQLGPYAPL